MVKLPKINLILCLFFVPNLFAAESHSTQNFCFYEAGKYYNIDPALLISIAYVESNFNSAAIGKNKDSKGKILSHDYGLMQINQIHIPELKKLGIIDSENDLISDPCLNIQIGAWILYKHFSRCGVNWTCVGSYNAGFSDKNKERRRKYIMRVYKNYNKIYLK